MKTSKLALIGLLSAASIFTACGDDVTKVTKIEETSGMEIVASADSLGKCTAEISGEMKFATKENAVYVCADSAWKNVSETEKALLRGNACGQHGLQNRLRRRLGRCREKRLERGKGRQGRILRLHGGKSF